MIVNMLRWKNKCLHMIALYVLTIELQIACGRIPIGTGRFGYDLWGEGLVC